MTACEQVVENDGPMDSLDVVDLNVTELLVNVAHSKNSFILPVTLWVHGKKVQVDALIDSGATSMFINQTIVDQHHLVIYPLHQTYKVINADGTPNKNGTIKESVRAYLEIGPHKSKSNLLVTNLDDKAMIIRYLFLKKHNPEIN